MAIPPVAGTVQGSIATDGTLALNPDQKKLDIQDRIFGYDPEANPILTVATQGTPKENATEVQFKWLEDSPVPEWLTLNAGYNNAVTSIVLAAGQGAFILPNTVIKNMNTGEAMFVTAVVTDTLTVTRGWGGTTALAGLVTDPVLNLRNAQPQGAATPPNALQTIKATKVNYCQIVTHAVQVTKTIDAVELYGGNERIYQRGKMATEHARSWEQLLMHGVQGTNIVGQANPFFTSGGLDYYIATNVLNVNGPLTESQFMSYLGTAFRFSVRPGRKSKVLFASQEMLNTINSWGVAKLQVTPNSDKASAAYGLDIKEFICGFGRLSIIFHPLLENGQKGTFYLLDMDGVAIRYLRPTKLETNIQAPAADFYLDKYITEAGFRVAMEQVHGRATGITY